MIQLQCCLCGGPSEQRLCAPCAALLPHQGPACSRCAMPTAVPVALCGDCQRSPPAFDAAVAALRYEAPVDTLLARFKFDAHLAAGVVAADCLRAALRDRQIDALLPIPLHATRLRERGFNQSQLLAQAIAASLPGSPPVLDALRRTRATAAQSGLDAAARARNVRGAFAVEGKVPAQIALIDDVMTTGATLDAAAKACKRAGADRVEVYVVARRP